MKNISIDFEILRDGLVFKDSIVLPQDHNLSDEQIEDIKQARFKVWSDSIIANQEEVTE